MAWDVLPEGKYDPDIIEQWLQNVMAPAIIELREAVHAEETGYPVRPKPDHFDGAS
jgi:hypothetical protein